MLSVSLYALAFVFWLLGHLLAATFGYGVGLRHEAYQNCDMLNPKSKEDQRALIRDAFGLIGTALFSTLAVIFFALAWVV